LTDEVTVKFDVLRPFVENRVAGDVKGSLTVGMDGDG